MLLVRRSQTVGDEVRETTKTKKRQKLSLATELLDVLRWHVDHQISEDIRAMRPSRCSSTTARSRKPRCARGISLAGVREAMSAGGMEVVCIDPKNGNGQVGSDSQLALVVCFLPHRNQVLVAARRRSQISSASPSLGHPTLGVCPAGGGAALAMIGGDIRVRGSRNRPRPAPGGPRR